jgi:uncharacterized cupin superfamily protein
MVPGAEAPLEPSETGVVPAGEGWFVVNARDARWLENELGAYCGFEGESRFEQLGINLNVMEPGVHMFFYHLEDDQEDFLVLAGEALLLIEGEERPLKAWDFVHCPPGAEHVFVGAGDGPCVILMVGARLPEGEIVYPVSELALRYGAGVQKETHDPREAYSDLPPRQRERLPDMRLPWQ